MKEANLRPFLRHGLDVLFIALNSLVDSNKRGHYFSGGHCRLFKLLADSGLTIREVDRETGDELVFGQTSVNFVGSSFGMMDAVEDVVETNSRRVRVTRAHVGDLIAAIREYKPRIACILHGKVRKALNRHGEFKEALRYGWCGPLLPGSETQFVLNYFPSGNNVRDVKKVEIFMEIREKLKDISQQRLAPDETTHG